jgi:hypothetical protein
MLIQFENDIASDMMQTEGVTVNIVKTTDHFFSTEVSFSPSDKRVFPSVMIDIQHTDVWKQGSQTMYTKIANVKQTLFVFTSSDNMHVFLKQRGIK